MHYSFLTFVLSGFLTITEIFSAIEMEEALVENVIFRHFSIKNREAFRVAALEGALADVPIQTHSYEMSNKEFKKAEKVVLRGGGDTNAWVSAGLAYQYGIPKINLPKSSSDALEIMLKPAQIDRNVSAIFHVAAMVADDEVKAYFPQVRTVLSGAERLALSGSSPLLTVLLEIDQQTSSPVLEPIQYKQALKRIVRSVPNARAYIALAQCTDKERFSATVHGYYKKALALAPDNVDAFFGAGVVVDNGHRAGVNFPEGTPTSLYYFGEAYARGKLLAGNYYGSALYERAAITANNDSARRDFSAALNVLEESIPHDQDVLLSLADYHATEHAAKPASFAKSFDHIKNYMQYKHVDISRVIEVIENLKASMTKLEHANTSLFGKVIKFQNRWFSEESGEAEIEF